MIILVVSFMYVVGGFFLFVFVFHYFSKSIEPRKNISNELTLIVPFRNEASNVKHLLSSLDHLRQLPKEVIFVDDHSTDQSFEIIQNWANNKHNIRVLQLPDSLIGKKQAIYFGVENSTQNFCLTIDADTWMAKDFFEKIEVPNNTDLQIRPVIMKGENLIGIFASTEYMMFNALNYLISPIYQMSASGANLVFKKSMYLKNGNLENHQHISSGDDHFLLRNLQKKRANIDIKNGIQDAVYTNAPKNLKEYFNQRIRWLGKTMQKTSMQELILGAMILFYLIGSFILLFWLVLLSEFKLATLIFFFRLIIDTVVFLYYSKSLKVVLKIFLLPLFQIVYPVFFTSILMSSVFYKPTWKGRRV